MRIINSDSILRILYIMLKINKVFCTDIFYGIMLKKKKLYLNLLIIYIKILPYYIDRYLNLYNSIYSSLSFLCKWNNFNKGFIMLILCFV